MKKDDGNVSVKDIILLQKKIEKDFDINKSDSDLTEEEKVQKVLYQSLDKIIKEVIGEETKNDIDQKFKEMQEANTLSENLNKLVGLGKEIEKNFFMQYSFLVVHFSKDEQNSFYTTIEKLTDNLVNNKDISNGQRLDIANKALEIIDVYKKEMSKHLSGYEEVISSLLESFEKKVNSFNFSLLEEAVESESIKEAKKNLCRWLELSKKLLTARKKAYEAFIEDLNKESVIPNLIIDNKGSADGKTSGTEMFLAGDRMKELLEQSSEIENEIKTEREEISKAWFGEPESYLEDKGDEETKINQTETKNGNGTRWIVVIVLTIIALAWGVWSAIGIFVLGLIIINVLSKNGA